MYDVVYCLIVFFLLSSVFYVYGKLWAIDFLTYLSDKLGNIILLFKFVFY